MTIKFARWISFLLIVAFFSGVPIQAGEPEDVWRGLRKLPEKERQKLLLLKAMAEGEVVWYASLPPDLAEPLRTDFEKLYPGVKIKTWRGRGEAVSTRVLTEARAGSFSVDVIWGSNEFIPALTRAGIIGQYSSPERDFYSDASRDREGLWTSVAYLMPVMAYNTNLVPEHEAPKSYEDFLNPKWKGSFAIDTSPDRAVMGWLKLWGSEKTERFLQGLVKNDVAVRSGHTLMTQLLCAGEFKAAIELYAHRAAELKAKGCPLEMVFPDPTIGGGVPLHVAKRSPHPYAASLLVDYLLSARGQRILAAKGFFSGRKGIKPKSPELDLEKRGVGTLFLTPEDIEQWTAKYLELRERYLLIR